MTLLKPFLEFQNFHSNICYNIYFEYILLMWNTCKLAGVTDFIM